MNRHRLKRIITAIILAVLGFAPAAAAQTNDEVFPNLQWNFATPGARANGMGRTFIGTADDATATVTNPAGLVSLTKPQIYGEFKSSELSIDRLSARDSLLTGIATTTAETLNSLSFFSVSAPLTKSNRLAAAFSFHQFLDYRENLNLADRDVPGTTRVFFPVNGEAHFKGRAWGGSVAYRLIEGLRAGVTVAYNQLDAFAEATRTGVPRPGFTVQPGIIANRTVIDSDESAVSATVGVNYKTAGENFGIGVTYARSPRFDLSEDIQVNPSTTANQPLQQATGFPKSVEFNVPDRFGFGVSGRPMSRLLVAFDVVRVQYSSLTENTTIIFNEGVLAPTDYNTPDATEVHFGGEFNLLKIKENSVLVRGGVFTNPEHLVRFTGTGSADAIISETAKTNLLEGKDETRGTVGAGFVFGARGQVDVAYVFGRDFVLSAALRF